MEYKNINNKSGIYVIYNKINSKIYIGSTYNFITRKSRHFNDLRNNRHSNNHLQLAWNKYQEENFKIYIVEFVEDIEDLLIREQYWLDKTQCYNNKIGYNYLKIAGTSLGCKHSEESKLRRSKLFSGKNNPFYGKTHSEKVNKLNSDKHKKAVIQTELNGTFIKEWDCASSTNKSKSSISKCCRHTIKCYDNSLWFYKTEFYDENFDITKYINPELNYYNKKKVVQLDLDENIINIWNSIKEAANSLNTKSQNIINCCKGVTNSFLGYKWNYY
jgi:group I intron endonuclease